MYVSLYLDMDIVLGMPNHLGLPYIVRVCLGIQKAEMLYILPMTLTQPRGISGVISNPRKGLDFKNKSRFGLDCFGCTKMYIDVYFLNVVRKTLMYKNVH